METQLNDSPVGVQGMVVTQNVSTKEKLFFCQIELNLEV